MRAIFGIVGLLLVVVIVGLLAKKQLVATPKGLPPTATMQGAPTITVTPDATVKAQSQQIQQQVQDQLKQAMDAAAQGRNGVDAAEKP